MDCPATRPSALLDNRTQVETPEGIDLLLRPAGVIPRALAFTLDLLARGLILLAVGITLALMGDLGQGLMLILLFLINWWYMVLFEVLNQGRTPGKQLMGLRVVNDDGTPVSWGASLLRNLLRFVDLLPFGYFLGLLSSLSHPAFKRLGDIAAGTLVVYREQLPARPTLAEIEPIQPPAPLTLDEQRAIMAFAERAPTLSQARRDELAGILSPVLDCPAEQADAKLQGIARTLLGAA